MKLILRLLFILTIFFSAWQQLSVSYAESNTAQSVIKTIIGSAESVGSYEKFEVTVDLIGKFKNPYDPDEIGLDGLFVSPSGKMITAPGFYYRDFDLEIVKSDKGVPSSENIKSTDKYSWKVRFTPDEVGKWTYTIQVTTGGKTTKSKSQQFTVTKSTQHGFLQVSKRDFHYLEFSDGTPFFGIGLNMGWYNEGKIADYTRWLDAFSASGGNLIRVWLAPWGFSPEWNDTPLGNYENRQDRAYELDKLFEMAAQKGIYIQLTLLNHGQFNMQTNPDWANNPYNAANGGPLKSPEEFATNPQALKLWKQRLRYIAARWGYSTHLMAWEWWNEINWTPLANPDLLAPWIQQSAAYLATLDPYKHLITHSGSPDDASTIWGDPSISITEAHIYDARNWAFSLVDASHKWTKAYQKPFLLAEFGYGDVPTVDAQGVRLHIGLWAALAGGGLGTGQFWWWDKYIEANNMYQPYSAIAAFTAGEDFAAHGYKPTTAKLVKSTVADVFGLQSDDYSLLWIVSGRYTDAYYLRLVQKNLLDKVAHPEQVTFPEISGLKLTMKDLPDGQYMVTWWDTMAGKPLNTETATASNGTFQIDVPPFETDLAVKIKAVK